MAKNPPLENQTFLFHNSIFTKNHQNRLHENYFTNGNGISTNLHPSSTSVSIQALEAELACLGLSSPAAPVNVPGHSWPPYFPSNRANGPNFFQHQNEYPPMDNGVSHHFYAETSRMSKFVGPSNGHWGGIGSMAVDGAGYQVLKRVIKSGDLRETHKIVEGVKDCIHELMVHPLGNDVVQTLFRFCHEYFIQDLLLSVIGKQDLFLAVCLHSVGQKAVVKLLDRLSNPQHQLLFASVISVHSVALAKSSSAGHEVLIHCLINLSPKDNEIILLEIAHSCVEMAKDKAGCCILPLCIVYSQGSLREVLVSPLIQEAAHLSTHFYGNFIIQFLIQLDKANIGTRVIQVLRNKFVELSLDKAGSHVVEKCLGCGEEEAAGIVFELMENNKDNWIQVFTNQYGNYVAQKALSVAKGEAYNLLVSAIKRKRHVLQFHPYGRNVVTAVKRVRRSSKSNDP